MEDNRIQQDIGIASKASAWLRIIRLQFYPMTFLTYSVGAALAARIFDGFDPVVYGLGYLFLFLTEVATVLTNEYYDYGSDSSNRNAGPFTGGSRILVDGRLSFREVKAGIIFALSAAVLCGLLLLLAIFRSEKTPVTAIVLILAGIALGMGYTALPLKLSHRGLGELVVGLTNAAYVILCGFVFQSKRPPAKQVAFTKQFRSFKGKANSHDHRHSRWLRNCSEVLFHPLPWILSLPIMFAIMAAITLSGSPDVEADRGASKKTLALLMGPRAAAWIAIVAVVIACAVGLLLWFTRVQTGPTGSLIFGTAPHSIILVVSIRNLIKSSHFDRPINTIMVLSLSYIVWFGIVPCSG